ncbi:3-dehydroquinate synthase [Pseudovibrio axinellae]|uniref:3-dehydroquinate synthase n=1 Tax=Pseudovibrio axinellae TaxID=989403 RepID=A0A165WZ24_9HYPH|nr:3-dehydroquinate synthase [Pseudovibrio axinellae]KZL17056.1 3-dehydroquinate synthase [Pseudovibrio axinellae]SEQ17961.1 3-dehydroquinate synthase [Pseudovibrio axinellae]
MIEESKATLVNVDLGDRSYPIIIGRNLIKRAGEEISARLPGSKTVIITDEAVAKFHLKTLEDSFKASGVEFNTLIVPSGEQTKRFEIFERLCDDILALRLERGDAVVALGGGVVGDLSGFVAGVVRRGMKFVQIPTTLLAQVDSSVGGKTGINSRHGKNLLGVFNQPALVLADTSVLDTLSPRDFRSGYAEVAKYGLINDPDFFYWLEQNWEGIFSGGPEREEAIAHSCRAKAAVVAADEFESGNRALLNLGHTFGHSLEGAVAYETERLVHGEGVSIGMVLAHEFSEQMGLCPPEDTKRVIEHLKTVGLPTRVDQIPGQLPPIGTFMDLIAQDKKVSRGQLTFVLTKGIGTSYVDKTVNAEPLRAFLEEKLGK